MPLAAAGIVCLGLVPTLGGPERPLHWAVTAGMAGFGVLLWARRRLRGAESALLPISEQAARAAGRSMIVIVAVIAALVAVIVAFRVHSSQSISVLSLALPGAALAWLVTLGVQMLLYRAVPVEAASPEERPSRRPPNWEALPNRKSQNPGSPDRQVNA